MKHKIYYPLLILTIFGLLFQIQYQGTVIRQQRVLILKMFKDLVTSCVPDDEPDSTPTVQPRSSDVQRVNLNHQGHS